MGNNCTEAIFTKMWARKNCGGKNNFYRKEPSYWRLMLNTHLHKLTKNRLNFPRLRICREPLAEGALVNIRHLYVGSETFVKYGINLDDGRMIKLPQQADFVFEHLASRLII